jgi:hypothetical protein
VFRAIMTRIDLDLDLANEKWKMTHRRGRRSMIAMINRICSESGFGKCVKCQNFAASNRQNSGNLESGGKMVDDIKQILEIGGGSWISKLFSRSQPKSIPRVEKPVIDFHRRKVVRRGEEFVIEEHDEGQGRRVWMSATPQVVVERCFRAFFIKFVTFENDSKLTRIEESAFRGCGLKSIIIPSSVVNLCNSCFCSCESLESVIFDNESKLIEIAESAFSYSGVKSIVIPSLVAVLYKSYFRWCEVLRLVLFENDSKLVRIEDYLNFYSLIRH